MPKRYIRILAYVVLAIGILLSFFTFIYSSSGYEIARILPISPELFFDIHEILYAAALISCVFPLLFYKKLAIPLSIASITLICISWDLLWFQYYLAILFDPYHGEPHIEEGISPPLLGKVLCIGVFFAPLVLILRATWFGIEAIYNRDKLGFFAVFICLERVLIEFSRFFLPFNIFQ